MEDIIQDIKEQKKIDIPEMVHIFKSKIYNTFMEKVNYK
jgi:hypothetical protein